MLLRSLGSGVTGLKNFQTDLDVIGNNIANVGTTGFKKSVIDFSDSFSQQLQGATTNQNPIQIGLGSQTASVDTITAGSTPTETDNPSDLYIDGDGYFQVTTGQNGTGTVYYTRAGDFTVNDQGYLVNSQGLYLAGQTGALTGLSSYTIGSNGDITGVKTDGTSAGALGTVKIYSFANPTGLEKMGGSLYAQTNASGTANDESTAAGNNALGNSTKIIQGSLEESNVDLTDEMTNLITAQRAYQANAQTITTADDILQTLVQLKRN